MTRAGSVVPVLTPQEIYHQLRDGPGTTTLDNAQAAAHAQAEREIDRMRMIKALAARIQAGWQGEASYAAMGACTPLARNAMDAGELLETARDLMGRQSEAFHDTATRVRPVSDKPPTGDVINDPFPFATDVDQQVRAHQADCAHNLRVYRAYDDASLFHETNMPTLYPMVDQGRAEVPREDPPPPEDPGGGGGGERPGPGDRGGSRGGGSGAPPPGVGSLGEMHVPQQTSPDAFASPVPQGSPPPVPVMPTVQSGQEMGYTHLPGTTPGTAGGSGGRGGTPTRSGPRAGGGTPTGSGPWTGGGTPARGGPGAPAASRPGASRGAAPFGGGPGARAAEEAARRPASGAGARGGGAGGGQGGGAPVGPGSGKGDNVEHERKVLLRADPEETFGSDLPTAPQVIGDERYEG